MDQMKEYEPEFDSMLFYLPLAGSTFKKVYYDDVLQRAVSKFVPADELVVPYSATSLDDAEAIVHVIKMSTNDLRKQQVVGFYRDVDVPAPGEDLTDELQQKEKELEGQTRSRDEDIHTILEFHADLDLENFEIKILKLEKKQELNFRILLLSMKHPKLFYLLEEILNK